MAEIDETALVTSPNQVVSESPETKDAPAFPSGNFGGHPGMSLRDYFAGQALSGMASGGWVPNSEAECADRLYKIADAMVLARDTPRPANAFSEREALLREAVEVINSWVTAKPATYEVSIGVRDRIRTALGETK